MCGKYTELHDAYKSITESFIHAGVENNTKVKVVWVNTEQIKNDKQAHKAFEQYRWNFNSRRVWFSEELKERF